MKKTFSSRCGPALCWLLLFACAPFCARAEYGYFTDVQSGSDIVMKEVRWPYWNGAYYNTWWSQGWTSTEGCSDYWYSGLGLPPSNSSNPVRTRHVINWSFWPISNPVNKTDTINTCYTSPNTFSMPTIGEGTIFRSPGMWTGWQTNVWYRFVLRTWRPVDGTPHLGYAGHWMRDGSSGVWYHMATVQFPFAVTGTDNSMSFQEQAGGGSDGLLPQRTDYRRSYYRYNGAWRSSTNWHAYVSSSTSVENAGLIANSLDGTNAAVYYEVCNTNNSVNYLGALTHGMSSPTYNLTQPSSPPLDGILMTAQSAVTYGNQLLVQWQLNSTSSPQFAYQIAVYTNASYSGPVVASAYDIAPEARQKLLSIPAGVTPYVVLNLIDIMDQTNAASYLAPVATNLVASTNVGGLANGLNYAYYQSATSYSSDSNTNWSSMPNFASLTPLSSGAVSSLDLTPRQRRNGYAFNYSGYINVPSDGLYAFTLNSCDGSKLYVDGQLVVNWDGKHSPTDLSGWIGLQAGYHALNVQYFFDVQPTSMFGDYFDTLKLSWEGPGISKTVVPVTAYYRLPAGNEPTISLTSPTNGAVVCDASVPFSANVTANGNTINKVQFYLDNYCWAQDSSAPYSLNSFLWASPVNSLRARLCYNTTNVVDSPVNQVGTTNMTLAPWEYNQIFYHNQPNGARIVNGTYSVIGDGVNLLTRQVNGDCTLIGHLAGITSSAAAPDGSKANTGWQAGLVLRGNTTMTPGYPWGLSGTAPFVAVFGQVDGGSYYQDQTMVNGGGGYSSGNLGGQKWFKLVRTNGTNFTSFVSSDGVSWTQVGNTNLTGFGTMIYAGFFTYAGPSSNPNIHWASFDNVSLTGNIIGPPTVSVTPAADTAFAGQSATFSALPGGATPFYYQWQLNGVNITGATNATLTLTNLQLSASGIYSVVLINANGAASASASLTVLMPPAPVTAILSNNPIGYWRLNETVGPTAYDSAGNYNGAGEGSVLFGVAGVTNAPFTAFEPGNPGAQFNGNSSPSDIAIAPFNVTTTNFSITGWVNCNGAQDSWSGLVFSRGSGRGVGLMVVNNGGNELRYSWNDNGNDYNAGTGLKLPSGQWAFLALTISPTNAIVYFATNSTLRSWTNTTANIGQTFSGNFYLGCDPNSRLSGSRQFKGSLDEIAIYNQTLTRTQISQILSASQTAAPPSVNLTAPASGAHFGALANITLAASVVTNGHAINSVQFFNGATLLGSVSNAPYSLAWSNVGAGSYTVLAQMTYDSTNTQGSSPAFITVDALPAAPQNVSVVAVAPNQASLTWNAASNATGYVISRNGAIVATAAGTGWLDTGLAPSTTYAYSVTATNQWGSSAPSVTNSVTTPANGNGLAWAANGTTAAAQDGTGNWGSGPTNWWNGSAIVPWTDGNIATFGAGIAAGNRVALTNDVTPAGIVFAALNGAYTLAGSGGGINLSGSPAFNCAVDGAISAVLKGTGKLLKTGTGTLTLSGVNTYTGGTTISNGTLQIATGAVVPGNIADYAALVINRSDSANFPGVINGTGSVTMQGSGAIYFTNATPNTYSGGTVVNRGTLGLGNNGSENVSSLGSGSVTVNSGGTLGFYPGSSSSTFTIPNALVLNGGTLRSQDGVQKINGTITVSPGGSVIQTVYGGKTLTFNGSMSGSGNLTLDNANNPYGASTLYLSADNPVYTGTFTVNAASSGWNGGQLCVSHTYALRNANLVMNTPRDILFSGVTAPVFGSLAGAGNLTIPTGVNLSVGNNNASTTYAGALLGAGALTKIGSGTFTLTGACTNSGPTAVNAGTLLVNGTLAPGSGGIGTLTASNKLLLAGTTVMKISRNGGAPTNDLVFVSGALTQGGSLVVTNIGTNALALGDSFKLFVASTYASAFTNVALPALTAGLSWNTSALATSGTLTVGSSPLPPAVTNLNMPANATSFSVTGTGGPNQNYVLLAATNLPPAAWLPVLTNTANSNGTFSFTDSQVTNCPQRFYRVESQ